MTTSACPRTSATWCMPMGCTMHMDGSVLSSIVKIAFLYGVFGKDFVGAETMPWPSLWPFSPPLCFSGAPGGGLVGEMLIVSMFNFPAEAFPIIATWLHLRPCRHLPELLRRHHRSMIVTRLVEGKDWLVKAVAAKKETA